MKSNLVKIESYVWCPIKRKYLLEKTTPEIVLGIMRAKRLALKGLEVSA